MTPLSITTFSLPANPTRSTWASKIHHKGIFFTRFRQLYEKDTSLGIQFIPKPDGADQKIGWC